MQYIKMECQKTINLLDNVSSLRRTYTGDNIKYKTTMLRSNLCNFSDTTYVLVKGTITITGAGDNAAARQADERNKSVLFKNCT